MLEQALSGNNLDTSVSMWKSFLGTIAAVILLGKNLPLVFENGPSKQLVGENLSKLIGVGD